MPTPALSDSPFSWDDERTLLQLLAMGDVEANGHPTGRAASPHGALSETPRHVDAKTTPRPFKNWPFSGIRKTFPPEWIPASNEE
jgi:hypothetical protein